MGRTIRTCNLLALGLLLMPAGGTAKRLEVSPLGAYVRGRVADRANDRATAVKSYSDALTMASDATLVAFRAYRAGVDVGDYELAVRAARTLDRSGILPPDARVLLYIAAVRERDWVAARRCLDRIGAEDGFDFLAPLFDGWLSQAAASGSKVEADRATAYAAENAALLAMAHGDVVAGARAAEAIANTDAYRTSTFRLSAAATLVARKRSDLALVLLKGDDDAFVAARELIARKKSLPGTIDTPARGASFVLQRMAVDLMTDRSPRSAVTLARFALFADPESPQARLVAAAALGFAKRHEEALTLVEAVSNDQVHSDVAASTRIDLLEAMGRTDEAYAQALTRATRSTNDMTRLGDIEARRGNFIAAAGHYRRVIDGLGKDRVSAQLWLALGNALDQGGDWKAARPAIEQALSLSPDDPRLLNQLGFGMADRGENLDRALMLLQKASRAQPDNAAITDSVGWAEYRSGQIEAAIVTLERARGLDPAEPEIAEHLGDAYWAAGRRIEARYAWTAAREIAIGPAAARLADKIAQGRP